MDKFALQKRLIFAPRFYVDGFRESLCQEFGRLILFTGCMDQFDELALRRAEVFRFQAFAADFSQPTFQVEQSVRCRFDDGERSKLSSKSSPDFRLARWLSSCSSKRAKLGGKLSRRPSEIFPFQFVGVFGEPFSELRKLGCEIRVVHFLLSKSSTNRCVRSA